jgi:hypothetical protein
VSVPEDSQPNATGQKPEALITPDLRILSAQILHALSEADTFSASAAQLALLESLAKEPRVPASLQRKLLQVLIICASP